MKVTTVTVEVKETRNHPHAYGNRGARIAYTVELEEGETPDSATMQLRQQAREQVDGELDQWILEIELEDKRVRTRSQLNYTISNAREGYFSDDQKPDFEDDLSILPADEQEKYRQELVKAQMTFWEKTKERLDDLIARAAQSGSLTQRQKDIFEEKLGHLPESERAAYRQRLDEATESKVVAIPSTEPKPQAAAPVKDEEVPF